MGFQNLLLLATELFCFYVWSVATIKDSYKSRWTWSPSTRLLVVCMEANFQGKRQSRRMHNIFILLGLSDGVLGLRVTFWGEEEYYASLVRPVT